MSKEKLFNSGDELFNVKLNVASITFCFPNRYPHDKKSLNLEDLIIRIKSNLDMDNISYVGDLNRSIEKICIIGGETLKIEYLQKLKKEGCDCIISGKLFHNIANYAKEIGLVDFIVPEKELDKQVEKYVKILFSSGPKAISEVKTLVDSYEKMKFELIQKTWLERLIFDRSIISFNSKQNA